MKKKLLQLVSGFLFFFIISGPAPDTSASGKIEWQSYKKGISLSKSISKKVFINFHADWCRYCLAMEKETFTNSAVVAYLNKHFIPIKVDSEHEKKIADQYQVRGLPLTCFLSETAERIACRPGYISADELLQILKYIGTDSYKHTSFNNFLKNDK